MYAELGLLSLYICLMIHLCAPIVCYFLQHRLRFLRIIASIGFLSAFIAFICLVISFGISDFSVLNVVNNSHTAKPLIYKIAAAWGNHEGSMLLWIITLSFFSLLFAHFAKGENSILVLTLFIQNILISFFSAFTIFTSSPFKRIFPAPLDGLGLNPILQDIGLAMHPPMLYLGYVGFSICYSAAIASLIIGQVGREFAKLVKPWLLLSFAFLTLGIALGSWWAYRELGWGGFWFWDAVENSSLMPWLLAVALLHSLVTLEKRGSMQHWSIILSIATFTFSMIGTFLVRSNLITSVHAFANDPKRGLVILIFLGVVTSIALLLYACRGYLMKETTHSSHLFSREPFLYINNLLLTIAAFIVIFGTLYPSLLEMLTGKQVSVSAPYFNQMLAPLSIAALLFMHIGSQLNWRKGNLMILLNNNLFSGVLSAILTWLLYYREGGTIVLVLLTFFSLWTLLYMLFRAKYYLKYQTSMWLAHIGLALLILAISQYAAFSKEVNGDLMLQQKMKIADFDLMFKHIELEKGSNYIARVAYFDIYQYGALKTTLKPQTLFFPVEGQQTTEAAIYHGWFYDLYLTSHELDDNGVLTVTAHYKPMISFIWLSALMMVLAAIISFCKHISQSGHADK